MRVRSLDIYLNDHYAGAVAGVELARRRTSGASSDEEAGLLRELVKAIDEDRRSLREIMASLGVDVSLYKAWAAWIGERLTRLKPNGSVVSVSPLTKLIELESLRLAVEGKASGWRSLLVVARHDSRLDTAAIERLHERAQDQLELLEGLRMHHAAEVLAGANPRSGTDSTDTAP
jgi:hypothetical protein